MLQNKTEKEIEDMSIDSPLIYKLMQRNEQSKDFNKLKFHKYVPLFVYDYLMTDWRFSIILRQHGAKYLGQAKTAVDSYVLYKYYPGHTFEPMIVALVDKRKDSKVNGHLQGDVYAVPPEMILTLDKAYNNGNVYYRHSTSIFLTDQKVEGANAYPCKSCFIYLGFPEVWEQRHLISMNKFTSHKGNKIVRTFFRHIPTFSSSVYPERGPHWRGPLSEIGKNEEDEGYMFDPNGIWGQHMNMMH